MKGVLRAPQLRGDAPLHASGRFRSSHVVTLPLVTCNGLLPVQGNTRRRKTAPLLSRGADVDAAVSALDLLNEENRLLKQTIAEAELNVEELEEELLTEGVDVPSSSYDQPAHTNGSSVAESVSTAEDYWTPQVEPTSAGLAEQIGTLSPIPSHDGTDCFKWDKTMGGSADHFKYRWNLFKKVRQAIEDNEGGLDKFSQGYHLYGLNRGSHNGVNGIWYREWAPAAKAIALIGEFNNWQPKDNHWAVKNTFGTWELFLPDAPDGSPAIAHRTKIKCRLETPDGQWVERIPAWIKWATQEWNEIQYNGVYYAPPEVGAPGELPTMNQSYTFKYPRPPKPRSLRIYECHVGMSSVEPKVNSYLEFRRDMLPRIRSLGYNAIQIMAVQEHAYYGSFGYHVTNFFAASSRFGSPDELKALIDEAHRLGLVVLMDIVHSHASKNTNDGINMFDGTDSQYFHSGARGNHWMWDSRLFNYGNWETLRFLLSNSRWWIDEYKFDGYRFDGVTSMMYTHHGLQYVFTGNYKEYFGLETDVDAVVYMMLMNNVLHDFFPSVITIGEDVSGMPAFARPWSEGGVGFDYRLQMAIADKWIEVLKTKTDEQWDVMDIVHCLTNRRYAEPCVGYAESHDQALVGDKTIAFWLMDAAMYDCMALSTPSPVVDRGIALHKMIRQLTLALGGESYLNFMGNEFGHPEWIDFPRDDGWDPKNRVVVKGNGGSYDKCRRRWDLAENPSLKYKYMNAFDRAMTHLDKAFGYVASSHQWISRQDNNDKLIAVERGPLLFVFNFHPTSSYTDYRVGCKEPGTYKVVLSSDEEVFGGWRNVTKDTDTTFVASNLNHDKRPHSFQVYAPSRTVVVYALEEYTDKDADKTPLGVPGLAVKGRGPAFER